LRNNAALRGNIWTEEDVKTEDYPQIQIIRGLNGEAALTEGQEETGDDTETFSDIFCAQ